MPGVEADDVIGTLAVRSVDAGFKVIFSKLNCFCLKHVKKYINFSLIIRSENVKIRSMILAHEVISFCKFRYGNRWLS